MSSQAQVSERAHASLQTGPGAPAGRQRQAGRQTAGIPQLHAATRHVPTPLPPLCPAGKACKAPPVVIHPQDAQVRGPSGQREQPGIAHGTHWPVVALSATPMAVVLLLLELDQTLQFSSWVSHLHTGRGTNCVATPKTQARRRRCPRATTKSLCTGWQAVCRHGL